jgi:hypothetical protein
VYKYLAYANGYLVFMRDLDVVEGFVQGFYGKHARVAAGDGYVVYAHPLPWSAPVGIAADLGKQRPEAGAPPPAFPFAVSDAWGNDE